MITVNDIRVSSDSTNITVDVTPPIGDALVSARLWDATTYKVVADAIDFSDLTGAGPFFADIEVTIPATRLGLTAYNGVYFLEIVTETLLNVESTMEVAISATTAYHKCILDKILNISVDNCKLVTTEDCKECSPYINEIDTFHLLSLYILI